MVWVFRGGSFNVLFGAPPTGIAGRFGPPCAEEPARDGEWRKLEPPLDLETPACDLAANGRPHFTALVTSEEWKAAVADGPW